MLAFVIITIVVLLTGALAVRHTIIAARMDRDRWQVRCGTAEADRNAALARVAMLEPNTARVVELERRLAEHEDAPDLDPDAAAALLAEVDVPPPYPGMPALKKRVFDQQACQHCGGLHSRACPRVRRIAYNGDGKPTEVEFWPAGRWPEDDVLWLEDVMDAAGGVSGQG